MKENTRTWPTGESGMMRMMMKGMKVTTSLAVRRSDRTCSPPPPHAVIALCLTAKQHA